ncbi:hypothetical protein BZA05DRAFT_391102 [Tricharina praecox]|uniref:uncharacterized protein n=1 Tax=Tricharina praecox TaxID=43433 RepID=UPI0022201871|nr:uncharacterized protein BZA05DRAFT_391102 [Tricharina praecox]KAI5855281.1 hypothetical protein BZA05DRAFT_391102 [Tricharina praecox]
MWIRVVEAWLVARLLASPTFHRAVRRVHGRLTGVRHLQDEEEPSNLHTGHEGGSDVDNVHAGADQKLPVQKKVSAFLKIYVDELRNEFRRKP